MKIVERDKLLEREENERKSYLLGLKTNKKFQKYYVGEIIIPMMKQLSDLKWIYENNDFVKASDEEISDIIRMNRNTYTVLTSLVSPILSDENKEKL